MSSQEFHALLSANSGSSWLRCPSLSWKMLIYKDLTWRQAIENALSDAVSLLSLPQHHTADVDGHDVGSGEVNIFIITTDPARTFRQSRMVLERNGRLGAVTAAYRPVDGDDYTVVW